MSVIDIFKKSGSVGSYPEQTEMRKKMKNNKVSEVVKAATVVKTAVIWVVAFIRFFLYGKKDNAISAWLDAENKPYTYDGNMKIHVSDKNKKLVPNAQTAFIIWNLPSIFTCPGEIGRASCRERV